VGDEAIGVYAKCGHTAAPLPKSPMDALRVCWADGLEHARIKV
jgi:hypothetical protein